MALGNWQIGVPTALTASGLVKTGPGGMLGIFVSAASATPTITVYDATTATGSPIVATFTPAAATWYPLPFAFVNGLYVAIGGTVSATVDWT